MYVSISQELLQSVRNKLNSMKLAELTTLPNTDNIPAQLMLCPVGASLVTAAAWGDLLDIKDRLGKLTRKLRVDIKLQGQDYIYELQIPDVTIPNFQGATYYLDVTMDPDAHPLLRQYVETRAVRRECDLRWGKVTAQVVGFLEKSKSLNEAIKLWPDVTRYVEQQYIDKVNKKTTRAPAEASEAAQHLRGIDMDIVQTSTVLARMAGART